MEQEQQQSKKRRGRPTNLEAENRRLRSEMVSLQEQMASVMQMLASKQPQAALTAIGANQQLVDAMLPPFIEKQPPRGIEYELQYVVPPDNITRPDVFVVTMPENPEDPNEPDPRYCVFCAEQTLTQTEKTQRIDVQFGYEIEPPFTEEKMKELRRLHIRHMDHAKSLRKSEVKQERNYSADHTAFTYRKRGRVKDEVAVISTGRRDKGARSITAAEWNEEQRKLRETKRMALANALANQRLA